jgi:dethiobiotin synthetase
VVPYVFAEALAPAVAARRAGIRIDLHMVRQRYVALARRHDLTLVEGAGGLLVPLADGTDFADVADAWQLPILIVARAGLGTLNHTALSVQCAQARGLEVLGVIINNMPDRPDVASKTNPEELARLIDVPILGVIPHQDGVNTDTGAWQPMAKAVAEHVDLASIRILAR